MIINAGFGGRDDIEWVTYGDTTLTCDKVESIIAQGRTIACNYNNNIYYLSQRQYINNMVAQYIFSRGLYESITYSLTAFRLGFTYAGGWGTATWGTVMTALAGISSSISITYADGTTGTLNYLKAY